MDAPSPWPLRAARVVVALAAACAFGPAIANPLVPSWDDGRFIVDSPLARTVSWDGFISILTEVHFEAWHPLHLLSYWLDVPWFGAAGLPIHATSLVLWVIALLLLLAVYQRLGLPLVAATLGVLVVGVHPIQVEAVTWATGRKEILALGFSCVTILAHIASERWSDRAAWMARASFVLAAMSKTTVLPLPGVLLFIDVFLRDVPLRAALKRQLPLVGVAGLVGLLVVGIWSEHDMIREGTPVSSAGLVATTYTHHLSTAAFPSALSPVYAIHRGGTLPLVGWLGPIAMLVAFLVSLRARKPRASFTVAAFFLLMLPASNVIPLYFQFQDRYLSLPLVALGFGFAAALSTLARASGQNRAVYLLGLVVALALTARTVQYGAEWSSDLRLWGHAARTQPGAFYAWLKLGEVRRDAGHAASAIDAYGHAIEVAPTLRLGHAGRFSAVALHDQQTYAAEHMSPSALGSRYSETIDDAEALRLLGGQLAERGYRGAVLTALGRSLDIDPIDDARLERAASVQRAHGEHWLARFYVERMTQPPRDPALGGYATSDP